MMGGYLTFSDDTKRRFKLPNHEIRHEFQRRLRSYYHAKYGIPRESFEDVTDALDNVLSSVHEESYRFIPSSFSRSVWYFTYQSAAI